MWPRDGLCCLAQPTAVLFPDPRSRVSFSWSKLGWECERDGCPGRKWLWIHSGYSKDNGPCHSSYCFPLEDPISPPHVNKQCHLSCSIWILSFIQSDFTSNSGISSISLRNSNLHLRITKERVHCLESWPDSLSYRIGPLLIFYSILGLMWSYKKKLWMLRVFFNHNILEKLACRHMHGITKGWTTLANITRR